MKMKLWRLSQEVNEGLGTYSIAVVAAETRPKARKIHPSPSADDDWWKDNCEISHWAKPEQVEVEYIGTAKPGTMAGVVCASYNP